MTSAFHPVAQPGSDGKFALPADGFVQFFPLGEFPGTVEFGAEKPDGVEGVVEDADGCWSLPIVQVLDAEAISACLANHRKDTLLDYEHLSNQPAGETRAAGWLENAVSRSDGLYGQVRWSADGLADVTGGNYRFLSPVFPWSALQPLGGNRYRPALMAGAALTNCPNLRTIKAVSNSGNPNRAKDGKFDESGTGNQTGGGQDPSRKFNSVDEARQQFDRDWSELQNPTRRAPMRVSANVARERILAGISIKASDGKTLTVPKEIEKHWAGKPTQEVERRLANLNLAVETIKTGKPYELPSGKSYYLQSFRDDQAGMSSKVGVVIARSGEVETWWTQRSDYLQRGDIRNRKEVRHERHSPPDVRSGCVNADTGEECARLSTSCDEGIPDDPLLQHFFLIPQSGNTGTAPALAGQQKPPSTAGNPATEGKERNMREQLIQALGLPPEATDEDIVSAVGGLNQRLKDIENAQQEAVVEDDLKKLGDKVCNREVVKAALLKNRQGTLELIGAIKAPAVSAAVVMNTASAKTPATPIKGSDLGREQERAVEAYRVENKCSHQEAWNAVRRARPELFTTTKE